MSRLTNEECMQLLRDVTDIVKDSIHYDEQFISDINTLIDALIIRLKGTI